MSEVDLKTSPLKIAIKGGCLVRVVQYQTVKYITTLLFLALIASFFYSLKLFVSAVEIRSHLGYFINMISTGDGDILPSLQAVPVFLFWLLNIITAYTIYGAFDAVKRRGLNQIMFAVVMISFLLLIILFIVIICVITHAYSAHESLHDGITTAMGNYSSNLLYKSQIDRLQITFQCCGSKKYDEWYTIKWFDPSLEQDGGGSKADGNTPFSCCSMKSLFPCVHHNIEVTGKGYLYTPEFNLSISTRGCYEIIREKKQQVGWQIVLNLCLFMALHIFITMMLRFFQTAHFNEGQFMEDGYLYTIWIFGRYVGRVKEDKPQTAEIKDDDN